jgi:hypothetical protein
VEQGQANAIGLRRVRKAGVPANRELASRARGGLAGDAMRRGKSLASEGSAFLKIKDAAPTLARALRFPKDAIPGSETRVSKGR